MLMQRKRANIFGSIVVSTCQVCGKPATKVFYDNTYAYTAPVDANGDIVYDRATELDFVGSTDIQYYCDNC